MNCCLLEPYNSLDITKKHCQMNEPVTESSFETYSHIQLAVQTKLALFATYYAKCTSHVLWQVRFSTRNPFLFESSMKTEKKQDAHPDPGELLSMTHELGSAWWVTICTLSTCLAQNQVEMGK